MNVLNSEKYDQLADASRVWIYQSHRPFTQEEVDNLNQDLAAFAEQWASHNRALKALAGVKHDRFVILMVDETAAGASGCSIDASVHFLQQLEQKYKVSLFDRTTFLYLSDAETIASADMNEFKAAYAEGKINDNTLVFDNLVNTKDAMEQSWLKPLSKSWHHRFV